MTAPQPGSPIAIEHIRLLRASFELYEDYRPKPGQSINVDFDFDVQRTFPTPRELIVVAQVAIFEKESDPPFRLRVAYSGKFSVTDDANLDLFRRFARYSAPGILIPYLREVITTVSARSGLGALIMPPVSVQQLEDQVEGRLGSAGAAQHSASGLSIRYS
jgi:preprotein translocase subunit SecB